MNMEQSEGKLRRGGTLGEMLMLAMSVTGSIHDASSGSLPVGYASGAYPTGETTGSTAYASHEYGGGEAARSRFPRSRSRSRTGPLNVYVNGTDESTDTPALAYASTNDSTGAYTPASVLPQP